VDHSLDNSLFSHPVVEDPGPDARTTPQHNRYGGLFLQPFYTPDPLSDSEPEHEPAPAPAPRQRSRRAHDPSGRRGRR
jgi:hypothetical protein